MSTPAESLGKPRMLDFTSDKSCKTLERMQSWYGHMVTCVSRADWRKVDVSCKTRLGSLEAWLLNRGETVSVRRLAPL